eukprot:TRINITY_DN3754_c1_g3_i4.p2 TRINITY_DN3754_c1_g3~~TRINITY_DN3754_c1_g3_i4.p2  ORF type:complete len:181 (+),score=38.16 TRINITY_DN3754_c1_g3_i4:56-598(+)
MELELEDLNITNEFEKLKFEPNTYLETSSGTKISKKASIFGLQDITVQSNCLIREESIIRADLAKIEMGQCCVIGKNSTLHPTLVSFPKGVAFLAIKMGNFIYIKEDCIISSISIGSHVFIGSRVILGKKTIIKDNGVILEDSVVPEGTVIPSFTVWRGAPAKCIGRLSPSFPIQFSSLF